MNIGIEIDQDSVTKALELFDGAAIWAAIGRGMTTGARRVWERLPPYPDADPDSTYERTGELGRRSFSNEAVVDRASAYVELGNNRPGAGYVIGPTDGDPHQAWMHVGRWWQLDVEMAANVDEVSAAVNDAIAELSGSA